MTSDHRRPAPANYNRIALATRKSFVFRLVTVLAIVAQERLAHTTRARSRASRIYFYSCIPSVRVLRLHGRIAVRALSPYITA
jgi:hypothetical protein